MPTGQPKAANPSLALFPMILSWGKPAIKANQYSCISEESWGGSLGGFIFICLVVFKPNISLTWEISVSKFALIYFSPLWLFHIVTSALTQWNMTGRSDMSHTFNRYLLRPDSAQALFLIWETAMNQTALLSADTDWTAARTINRWVCVRPGRSTC